MIELSTILVDATYGLHPSLKSKISITDGKELSALNCSIGLVYQNVPVELIIDRYQIKMLFEEARLVHVDSGGGVRQPAGLDLHIWGDPDLEAPASILDPQLMGGLIIPLFEEFDVNYSATVIVPLHLRYLSPVHDNKHEAIRTRKVHIQPPSLIKFCNQPAETVLAIDQLSTPVNNFTNVIGPHVSVYEFSTAQDPRAIFLEVPVGVQNHQLIVEFLTAISVWLALAWICWCLSIDHHQQMDNKERLQRKKK